MNEEKKKIKEKLLPLPPVRTTPLQNIMLAVGLVLVLCGIFLLVKFASNAERVFAVRPVIFLCAGTICFFLAFALVRNGIFIFAGVALFLYGIIFLITDTGISLHTMRQLWPFFVISSGVALLPADVFKRRKVRSVFLFPAIALIFLGLVFLLFSFRIIKLSFTQFIAMWWPALIIIGGILLVVVFMWQQFHRKEFPYLEEDSSDEDNVSID